MSASSTCRHFPERVVLPLAVHRHRAYRVRSDEPAIVGRITSDQESIREAVSQLVAPELRLWYSTDDLFSDVRELESISNSALFLTHVRNQLVREVSYQGWSEEPFKSSEFPRVQFNREAEIKPLGFFRCLPKVWAIPAPPAVNQRAWSAPQKLIVWYESLEP